MNDHLTSSRLQPVLRSKLCNLLDLDGDVSPREDLAEFLMALLATRGTVLLVDSSGRDLLAFARLIAALEGSEPFHHCCTAKDSKEKLCEDSAGRSVWFLEEIDALKSAEQAEVGLHFLEAIPAPRSRRILMASVSSAGDSSSLAEELLEALGAVIVLPKLESSRLGRELSSPRSRESSAEGCGPEWSLLSNEGEDACPAELVADVVALADRIASLDPTSVSERPPIDALRIQLRVIFRLGVLRSAYGEADIPFGNLGEIHSALLAHRLRRVDHEGKSNQMIVGESVLRLASSAGKNKGCSPGDDAKSLEDAREVFLKLRTYLDDRVIGRGKDGPLIGDGPLRGVPTIDLMLAALFSEGHILFEDYPGTGKSYMIEKLSDCIEDDISETGIDIASYKHIQCVPDLMPSDLTGGEVFAGDRMVFRPGPVFAYLVLIDEINRTTPKVQAALLEAMADRKVTIGNHQYRLGSVFFVLATQNPLDAVGTYPLPQAQLDRFIFKRKLQPLDNDSVKKILNLDPRRGGEVPRIRVSRLYKAIQSVKREVFVSEEIKDLLIEIKKTFESLCGAVGTESTGHAAALLPKSLKEMEQTLEGGKRLLKEGSTPSPRSLQKFLGGLRAIAFIDWATGKAEAEVTVEHVRRLARDYFTHRITPIDESNKEILGELVDLVVSEAVARRKSSHS